MQEIEFVSFDLEYSAEEISKQRVEHAPYSKMQENKLREDLLNKKEQELDDLGNSHSFRL